MASIDQTDEWRDRFSPSLEALEQLAREAYGQLPEDFRALCQEESVFDIDTEIADRVLDLGVPQQNLDRPDVACGPIDHCGFCPPKRMRSVFRLPKTNRSHPFIDKARILPRAHVSGMIDSAWEEVVTG